MGFRDNVVSFYKNVRSQFASAPTIARGNSDIQEPVNDFGGSRNTVPKFTIGGGGGDGALPKKAQRELRLDPASLQSANIDDLIDTMMDAHPDFSFAIWNFLRIGNCDYDITVRKLGTGEIYGKGEKEITILLQRLEAPNVLQFEVSRSFKKVLNQLVQSVVTRGACSLELILTQDMKDVAFLAPVDPSTVEFRFEGDRLVPSQDEGKISLDVPTFFYEALDERIDDPYGRSPLLGAINMVMFQLQVLQDIKAVVHNQGYPRFDITILEEVLLQRMPIAIRNNEKEKQKWMNDRLKEIIDAYKDLEPDDTFVHYNSVEVDMVGGGKGGGAMIDPEKLMTVIDNLIMAGLKTLSTMMGRRSSGQTESFAKLEIKLYMAGVRAIQEVVERLISKALTLYLNILGKQAVVEFRYKPIEIRTELEQAQFEQIHLQNIAYKRDQGWIDQIEASNEAVGHDPVAEPNMEMLGVKTGDNDTTTNKDGGKKKGSKDEKGTDK